MKYNIVFSIPIHHRLEVVVDQILNFMHFNPNCAIVLHISQSFDFNNSGITYEQFKKIVQSEGNVYINPKRVRTGFYDIIQAHLLNFKYINEIVDFHLFSMCASNELFINEGLYDHIKKYTYGVEFLEIKDNKRWFVNIPALDDKDLNEMLKEAGGTQIIGSHIEGSFYERSLFNKICNFIINYYDYSKMEVKYAREEVYFSTLALALQKQDSSIKVFNPGLFTYVPWYRIGPFQIFISDIKYYRSNKQYFAVKRIDRTLNNYVRSYIRQTSGYESRLIECIDGIEKYSKLSFYTYDVIAKIKVFYDWLINHIKKNLLKIGIVNKLNDKYNH